MAAPPTYEAATGSAEVATVSSDPPPAYEPVRISVHATSPVLGSQSIAREVVVVVDKTFTLCDVWRSYFDDIVATFSLDVRRRVTGFSGTYEWVEKTSARTSISPLEKVQDGKSYIYNAVQVVTCSHVRNFISPKWTDIFSPGLADVAHPLRLYCLATAERMQCQAIDLGNRVPTASSASTRSLLTEYHDRLIGISQLLPRVAELRDLLSDEAP
ncbi:hypothetical protein AAVH_17747 [Aphelenchoides avenae]|nr:hypothetical protein AAVH_17747 [Aphelenchus avenae]